MSFIGNLTIPQVPQTTAPTPVAPAPKPNVVDSISNVFTKILQPAAQVYSTVRQPGSTTPTSSSGGFVQQPTQVMQPIRTGMNPLLKYGLIVAAVGTVGYFGYKAYKKGKTKKAK